MEYFNYFKQNRIKLTTLVVHGLQAYKNYSNFTCQQLLFLPQESNSLKTQYDESKTPLHKELPTIVCLNDPPACQLYHFPPESTTTSAPPHACFSKVYLYSLLQIRKLIPSKMWGKTTLEHHGTSRAYWKLI
jgi:hypothetical protein